MFSKSIILQIKSFLFVFKNDIVISATCQLCEKYLGFLFTSEMIDFD